MQQASFIFNIGSIFMLIKTFWGHLTLLKVQFCFEKVIGLMTDRGKILAFLNENKLDLKASFKITMQSNHPTTLEPPLVCNHVNPLWSTLTFSSISQQ